MKGRHILRPEVAWQKLSNYHAEVTPMTSPCLISADILDSVQKLLSFGRWNIEMDTNPEDEISYTAQHQDVFQEYVENKNCTKH
jgi:hypothetical protein